MLKDESPKMIDPCFPPYYPDEDRVMAADLTRIAGELMAMAGKVLEPDHYWKNPPIDSETKPFMPGPDYMPYYPNEDRQLAAELMTEASIIINIAGRVIRPDHYWVSPPYEPMDQTTK